jgi:DNA topoisomerase-2
MPKSKSPKSKLDNNKTKKPSKPVDKKAKKKVAKVEGTVAAGKDDNEIVFMKSTQYTKLQLRKQIRIRPDTYIGSVKPEPITRHVLSNAAMRFFDGEIPECKEDEPQTMILKELQWIPGFFKLFDELLVNTADHLRRNTGLTRIHIDIDVASGIITISNNGTAIPVEVHPVEKIYTPEMIFFHLLSGSNYDDTIKRLGGGRNGYGSKLVSIFAKWMQIHVKDHTRGLDYTQLLENNETDPTLPPTIHSPVIVPLKEKILDNPTKCASKDLVEISFLPDYEYFGLEGLDPAHLRLFFTRAVDLAGTFLTGKGKDVLVYLNWLIVT